MIRRLLWLLGRRRHRATLFLKSGDRLTFTASEIVRKERGDTLTSLEVKVTRGWPLFISLSEVAAIQTQRCWWWQ